MRRFLLPLALIILGCGYQSIRSATDTTLVSFKAATPIPMADPLTTDLTKRTWDHTIQLPSGITARLTATGWIGGRFYVQYSDESAPRIAGSPGDYVYPSALRIDFKTLSLYGLAQGTRATGNTPITLLFVYDLQRREPIHSYRIDNALITNP